METTRVRQRQQDPQTGTGDDPAADDGDMVTVSHWPYSERLPVGNMSVAAIRSRYADRFDIDPQSVATVDGHEASGDTVLRAGQMLMFVRRAGEKGVQREGEYRRQYRQRHHA